MTRISMALLAALACLAAAASARAEPPQRVVSINLCSDILAAGLAAPGTLKSVFRLGRDPHDSAVAHLLQDVPPNDGRIEDILPFAPDLVLAHRYTSPFTLDLLGRIGIPVVTVKDARTFADIRDNIETVAAALGREAEGAALVARFDAEMEAARRAGPARPTAILYQDLGGAVVPNSILGHILAHTGFDNVIRAENEIGLVYPGIEDVIAMRPDLMAIGIYRPGQPSQASALLQHPALKLYRERYAHEVDLPARDWNCSTPFVTAIAARLAAAHDEMTEQKASHFLPTLPSGEGQKIAATRKFFGAGGEETSASTHSQRVTQ